GESARKEFWSMYVAEKPLGGRIQGPVKVVSGIARSPDDELGGVALRNRPERYEGPGSRASICDTGQLHPKVPGSDRSILVRISAPRRAGIRVLAIAETGFLRKAGFYSSLAIASSRVLHDGQPTDPGVCRLARGPLLCLPGKIGRAALPEAEGNGMTTAEL